MRASKCLNIDAMGSWYFLLELKIELDFSIIHLFLFFWLFDFSSLFVFDFFLFLLSFEDSFPGRFDLNIFLRLEIK